MNYNNYDGWNECAGTYGGAHYAGDTAFARTVAVGGNRGSTAVAATAGTARSCGGTGRTCDLYWQGYMAGFYADNRCNQSAEARTVTQATDRTVAISNCCCSCNNCNNCGNWGNRGSYGNCRF